MSRLRPPPPRPRLLLQALEERVLYSADAAQALGLVSGVATDSTAQTVQIAPLPAPRQSLEQTVQTTAAPAAPAAGRTAPQHGAAQNGAA